MATPATSSKRPHYRPRRPARTVVPAAPAAPSSRLYTEAAFPAAAINRPSSPTADTKAGYFSNVRFRDFQNKGLEKILNFIPFEFCTEVQAETIGPILQGVDVFGQAKTGTGKTFAFLIPAVERLARGPMPADNAISVLILAPTRELAVQIEKEANLLLQNTPYNVQSAVGGTNITTQRTRLVKQRCDILVATPGRLVDHIQSSNFGVRFQNIQCFVMDEADQLLDQGFRPQLLQIINALPNRAMRPRQTLLFSATVSPTVLQLAKIALLPEHKFISTIKEQDENTHAHVDQSYITCPVDHIDAIMLSLIRKSRASNPNTKVLAFYPTARATALAFELFSAMPEFQGFPMFQVHSRMSQGARQKASDGFKAASSGIFFSSDVSARGIDIPGITAVYQINMPSSAEQYIHRLGRTARAGAGGEGILILAPYESYFLKLKGMQGLPLKMHEQCNELMNCSNPAFQSANASVQEAMSKVDSESKEKAYQAWLGYYNTSAKSLGWSKEDLVGHANHYAFQVLKYRSADGLPPALYTKTVGMMNLKGVPGLHVVKSPAPVPGARGRSNFNPLAHGGEARHGSGVGGPIRH